jgi:succinoglycan biosynthesis protein ExoM
MTHFTVAICTAKRPTMLLTALNSIMELSIPAGSTLSIIVVENDTDYRSKNVIDSIVQKTKLPVRYILEPRIGIPFARNRALAAALEEKPDWIAMLDDDERAGPDWLVQLHDACRKFDAQVASGPVLQEFDAAPPHWWKAITEDSRPTGSLMRAVYTNNVLFHSNLVATDGLNLRFDERLTFGAEDADFFQRARSKGIKMVWAQEARVVERVPASRLSLRRTVDRAMMVAASGTFVKILRMGHAKTWIKTLPHILRRIFVGVLYLLAGPLIWPASKLAGEKIMFKGIMRVTKATGSLRGLLGGISHYYNVVDGA